LSDWNLDPRRTALLVIDVQNDYAHKDGYFGKILGSEIARIRRILNPLKHLIDACKESNIEIIWLQSVRTPNDNERVRHRILPPNFAKNPSWLGGPTKGSWGAEIIEEVRPRGQSDVVIQKTRNSAFFKTNLEDMLRSRGIDTLLFTGLATNICVESSLRDAYFRDFDAILVEDCCAAMDTRSHDSTVRTVKDAYGVVASSKQVIASMKSIPVKTTR